VVAKGFDLGCGRTDEDDAFLLTKRGQGRAFREEPVARMNGVYVGDYVTVGHSVTLHGCKIEDRCLIGMGVIILNGAVVGSGSIIAAGTLIPEKTIIEPNSLWMGSPGKLRRHLDEKDQETILRYAQNYLGYKESYLMERNS